MQRHVRSFLYHIRLTEIYRGKTSLLSPFRRVIRTLAMPLLAHCLCWSHPAVRASCCSCYSPSWLPTPELLENYLAKWHGDKRENPRTFPITDEKEYSIAVFSAKEIKLTSTTSFAYQFLIALMLDKKRKLLNSATSELKKLEVCTELMHYYAGLLLLLFSYSQFHSKWKLSFQNFPRI